MLNSLKKPLRAIYELVEALFIIVCNGSQKWIRSPGTHLQIPNIDVYPFTLERVTAYLNCPTNSLLAISVCVIKVPNTM